ncbi:hypothetical protein GCM10023200_36400 [Actinomycetospora chlora]|uniref:Lipoprotein n=1 Tax=Actinomycetospora chlora TaxID=663608 RepID=A0ABP9BKK6_9PSEU
MRRLLLPLVVLLVGVLAGCSYGAEAAPPQPRPMGPGTPSGNPTPETWLAQVCTAVTPAVRAAGPVPEARPDDLPAAREQMLAYLDQRIAAFDAAADGVDRAGPAPVDDGQQVTEPVVRLLRERSASMAGLREELDAVPAVADATLAQTLTNVRNRLVLAGPTVVLPDLALPPSLAGPAATVPSCRALGVGVGAGGGAG